MPGLRPVTHRGGVHRGSVNLLLHFRLWRERTKKSRTTSLHAPISTHQPQLHLDGGSSRLDLAARLKASENGNYRHGARTQGHHRALVGAAAALRHLGARLFQWGKADQSQHAGHKNKKSRRTAAMRKQKGATATTRSVNDDLRSRLGAISGSTDASYHNH